MIPMGVMRSIGKAVSGTLFTISLALALTLMGVVNLTSYQTLQPIASNAISQQISSVASQQQLSQALNQAKQQCQGQTEIQFQLQGINFTVPCSQVNNATPQDVPNLVASAVVNQTVQKTYSCQPIQCLQTLQGNDRLLYVFSSDFNNFLKTVLNALWIATAVTAIGYFFALEGVAGRLKGFGVALIWVGIPYFTTGFLQHYISSLLLPQASAILPLLNQIVVQLSNNFLYAFVIGVVLLVAGFILGRKRKKK
jgi:LPXTG-motif cell wall-anchored protein